MARAGIEPAVAAPSQLAPAKMLVAQTTCTQLVQKNRLRDEATARTDTVYGVWKREKEGKEARKRESSQDEPAQEK